MTTNSTNFDKLLNFLMKSNVNTDIKQKLEQVYNILNNTSEKTIEPTPTSVVEPEPAPSIDATTRRPPTPEPTTPTPEPTRKPPTPEPARKPPTPEPTRVTPAPITPDIPSDSEKSVSKQSNVQTTSNSNPRVTVKPVNGDASKYKLLKDFDKEYETIKKILNNSELSNIKDKKEIALQIFNPFHDFIQFVEKMMGDLKYTVRIGDPPLNKFLDEQFQSDLLRDRYVDKHKKSLLAHVEYIKRMIDGLRPNKS